jgi:hypothetical protein
MGKYGDLIQQAKAELREDAEPESRADVKTVKRKAVKPSTRKAVKTELRKNVKTSVRKDGKTARRRDVKRESVRWADTGDLITIGAKVPADVAQHWIVEAKRRRTSLTYIIAKALLDALGAPDGAVLEDED